MISDGSWHGLLSRARKVGWDCSSERRLLMAGFSAWRLYFLRRLLWYRTAGAHRWRVLRQSHSSTALGGVELVSGSHRVVRWFRNTAQQLPKLVLLSSVRGIWCGLGGSSVRIPLTRTGPHTRTHTMPITHTVPPLTRTYSMSDAHALTAHSAHNTRA